MSDFCRWCGLLKTEHTPQGLCPVKGQNLIEGWAVHHLDYETSAAMDLADMHARERARRRIYLIVIWGAVVVMLGTVLSVWLRDMTYWAHRLPKL